MDIGKQSLENLEYNKILELVANYAKISQSKKLCLSMQPHPNRQDVETALKYTKEARQILDMAQEIPIEFVIELDKVPLNVEYFMEEELVDFAKTLRTSRLVKSFLRENSDQESLLNGLASEIFVSKEIEDNIFDTFDSNYQVKQNATQTLAGLYSSLKDTESALRETATKLLNTPSFNKHLQEQIYTVRDDRVVFQVKAPSKNLVSGIVHDVSSTSKTFYIEPSQIVPLNNKIREVNAKIKAEILEILTNLSNLIKTNIHEIKTNIDKLAQIDFHFAKARYSVKTSAIMPELAENKIIKIEEMRHPLLIGRVENIVENDFAIGEDYKSVIITGSNTGGKTVALKTIGLFLLMLKSGLFLPCGRAVIYPFRKVFADIGDSAGNRLVNSFGRMRFCHGNKRNILSTSATFTSNLHKCLTIINHPLPLP